MTHPRVSNDKNWVAYTAYNDLGTDGCASLHQGYLNTEIRAVRVTGADDKRVISPTSGVFSSNNYWIGSTNEMTYLSGPVNNLKFLRASVDASMNLIAGPTQIPFWSGLPSVFVPMDPQSHSASNRIVFPALYNDGANIRKSLFLMNLSDGQSPVALTLGRDHAGNIINCANAACENIMENDPKISPDGSKVTFMRRAQNSGANGFGWHIFVVPVATPLAETDISWLHLSSNVNKNDALPEWIDNNTLIFSTIEISGATFKKDVYTMKSDGSQRTRISLPAGFHYSDVYPFTDGSGKKRIILSAEKIGATCN